MKEWHLTFGTQKEISNISEMFTFKFVTVKYFQNDQKTLMWVSNVQGLNAGKAGIRKCIKKTLNIQVCVFIVGE